MLKKEISWIGLINALIADKKKAGEPAGVKDVMGDAKKQWVDIKAGKHQKYVKGKPNITRKKGKKGKKGKTAKTRCEVVDDDTSASEILDKCELCKKCLKEIKKHIK
jgi:hypothetical protein